MSLWILLGLTNLNPGWLGNSGKNDELVCAASSSINDHLISIDNLISKLNSTHEVLLSVEICDCEEMGQTYILMWWFCEFEPWAWGFFLSTPAYLYRFLVLWICLHSKYTVAPRTTWTFVRFRFQTIADLAYITRPTWLCAHTPSTLFFWNHQIRILKNVMVKHAEWIG